MRKLCIIILLFAAIYAIGTASASIFLNSFNSGQVGEELKQRHDLDRTAMGSEELENILTRPQGMAYKRPGTEYIDDSFSLEEAAVPPAATRDEAYALILASTIVFFDPNWAHFSDQALPDSGVTARHLASDSTGIVVTGYAQISGLSAIARWETDMTQDEDFFTPDAGWGNSELVYWSGFTDGDDYLYATTSLGGATLYKFDASTGAEVWNISGNASFVDSADDIYGGDGDIFWKYSGVDGSTVWSVNLAGYHPGTARDNYYDLDTDQWYSFGSWIINIPPVTAYQIISADSSGGNIIKWPTGASTASPLNNVIRVDDYLYTTGALYGQGGANVGKFDLSLNLLASATCARGALGIVEDWDGNIAVMSNAIAGTNNSSIYTFDTDLNAVNEYQWTTPEDKTFAGSELVKIVYLDSGTTAISIGHGAVDKDRIRLLPFEYSTNDAYVLEFGHEYIGFLRTTQ